jgi:hypothetical protein
MIALSGAAAVSGSTDNAPKDLAAWIPAEIQGWTPKRADGLYTRDNLYDYIDGGAEVYLSFSFQRMVARRYGKAGAPDIIADLFDMGSSEDAYGVYHHDVHESPSAGIGQESEYMEGALYFWKGRYFASIMAMQETEESKRAVLELGKAVASAIPAEGPPPDLVERLPKKGMDPKQVHYFHNHFCLNAHYFLADDNILQLDAATEGMVARYAPASGGAPMALVLVRYPAADQTEKAFASFKNAYLHDADAEGIVKTENGKWAGARLVGSHIIGVFDAPSKPEILRMFSEVNVTHPKGHDKGEPKHE